MRPVLILTYVYPPDNYSGAARPHRLAKYLRRLGHPVTVIAGRVEDGIVESDGVYRVRGEFDHAPSRRFPWFHLEKVGRLAVLPHDEGLTWVGRAVRLAQGRGLAGPETVVLSTSPPVTVHMAAWWLKKRTGCAWIADFRDPLVENPYRRLPRGVKFDVWLEKRIFRAADLLIANTTTVQAMWERRRAAPGSKLRTLWNGFDPEHQMKAGEREGGPRRLWRHVGSIYGDRYPLVLRTALERLVSSGQLAGEAFRVELIGPLSADRPPLGAEWWAELPPVPAGEANRLVQTADGLILLDATKTAESLQVPAKIFDYVRIGRPVLAWTKPGSPVERILRDSGLATVSVYPDDEPEVIERKILDFWAAEMAVREPSETFRQMFDAENQARQLSGWIAELPDSAKAKKR